MRVPGQNNGRAGLMVDGATRRAALARVKTAMMKAAMSGLYHTGVPGGCPPEKDADCFPAEKVQFKATGN